MSEGKRRLAAVMFTDMVGYTALGQRNESLSLALVDEQRKLIRPILLRHEGKEIKTVGDAILVQFPNALDAVRCAYDIQRATREFNMSISEGKRIHLRVGLHLGDVVESEGDISGDAVNVASRIESLAEDGGVCLTRQVYDHVRNKFDVSLNSLGLKSLRNVADPIEVYKMAMPWEKETIALSSQLDSKRIAVLPFLNMSQDPNDSYFADGITEEIISAVSSVRGLNVISRTSVMGYKGTTKKVGEIGNELKAGSVLEGSFRKAGTRIRVTTQLIDVSNDNHVWTQSYDRELEDVFDVQTDIAKQVAAALKVKILPSEEHLIDRVPTKSTDAYILYLKGRYYWNERSEEALNKAVRYYEEAVKLDPEFALAYSGIADCYVIYGAYGWLKPGDSFPSAKRYAMKSIAMDPGLAEAHTTIADVFHSYEGKVREAEAEFKRALELRPSYATAHMWYGLLLISMKRFAEAQEHIKMAVELDPLTRVGGINLAAVPLYSGRSKEAIDLLESAVEADPEFEGVHNALGWAYLLDSRVEEGINELKKAVDLTHGDPDLKTDLACALGFSGRRGEASAIIKDVLEMSKVRYVREMKLAQVAFAMGENDSGFVHLEEAVKDHSIFTQHWSFLVDMQLFPWFAQVRGDPRWGALMKRLGIPQS